VSRVLGVRYSETALGPVVAECEVRPLAFYADGSRRPARPDLVVVSWPGRLRHGVCFTPGADGLELRSMIAVPGDTPLPLPVEDAALLVLRHGVLALPDAATSIHPGSSHDAAAELARALGYALRERPLLPDDLERADELLVVRAGEILPVAALDGRRPRRTAVQAGTAPPG